MKDKTTWEDRFDEGLEKEFWQGNRNAVEYSKSFFRQEIKQIVNRIGHILYTENGFIREDVVELYSNVADILDDISKEYNL